MQRGATGDTLYRRGGKRAMDVGFAIVALVLACPLLLMAWIAARLSSGASGLMGQDRVGKDLVSFRLWKLRSMRDVPGPSTTAADDPRITSIGRVLRRLKVDELPQLWNVLKGEMSLVGPRPEVPEWVYGAAHRELFKRALAIRPGLTDLASVILFDEEEQLRDQSDVDHRYGELLSYKLKLNVRYAAGVSLYLDVRVLALTAVAFFAKHQASARAAVLARELPPVSDIDARPLEPWA